MGIGARLKEERERLLLTQTALADKASVTKKSQINWEQGVAMPNAAVLAAYAELGVDVLYVLTGQRSRPVDEAQTLPPRERALIDNYRACDDDGKRVIEGAARLGSQSQTKAA